MPRRKRQDAVQNRRGSQGFYHCSLCQNGNNDQMRNSRWRSHCLSSTGLLPLLLLGRSEEIRSTKNFPLWIRKEKTTAKDLKLHTELNKLSVPPPGLMAWPTHVFLICWRIIHHSYIVVRKDCSLNTPYKCWKAEEHIKLKLHKPKQSFMVEKIHSDLMLFTRVVLSKPGTMKYLFLFSIFIYLIRIKWLKLL